MLRIGNIDRGAICVVFQNRKVDLFDFVDLHLVVDLGTVQFSSRVTSGGATADDNLR